MASSDADQIAADPAVVAGWIAQTQAERARAEAELRTIAGTNPRRISRAEIIALVTALGDITSVLRDADPADKTEVYRQLGLRLAYQPEMQTVRAEVRSQRAPWGYGLCPRPELTTTTWSESLLTCNCADRWMPCP
ncbi:hypothetical protein [Micromonospora sp. HK10]|uniref:hypothetical protein n=1 Tax=Micromonospora sp. HK10 TaxID=1538294 RepID=UPI000AA7A722|nr:hypothetical protein [Micromonospora sp. HK10]